MTDIIIIAAIAKNGIIGNKNSIPWHISEDFKRFKTITLGAPCIMGSSTYLSLPEKSRPLPGRENIVLTKNKNYQPSGVTIFNDFSDAIDYVNNKNIEQAFITGGAAIYQLGLSIANYMELTLIHNEFDGDVFFPKYNETEWEILTTATNTSIDRISKLPITFSYNTLRRKKNL